MIHIKNVLVPTDFSEPSDVALRYGKAFAESFQAALHLIHVLDESALVYPWTSPDGTPIALGAARSEMENMVKDRLSKILSDAEREKYSARVSTLCGSPFMEIVAYAKAQSIDLIVMGTHGRGPIAHMLMGSVAEKVVRKAPCPVLTVRHPEHEFIVP
ncbi:MAG TPA: universal stress protein [Pirellulales bacterium]|jgi:nucleotide-binding universal stress UspA family protein|nr:universal stress protein [Pirellulales bacterium]